MKDVAFSGGAVGDFTRGVCELDGEVAEGFDTRALSGADVERFTFSGSMTGSGDVGGDYIFDGNEVAGLFASAVDRNWGVALGAVGENADNAAIG